MVHLYEHAPIGRGEGLALLEAALPASCARAVLAVSGGADSLALLAFAGENRRHFEERGRAFLVVTVDHGLRPEAAEEAREVARLASLYGLTHRTLCWAATVRRGNLAAEAREARYALLCEAAEDFGATAILCAHHQDDQIETHLLARERGEGPRRLAGMRRCRELAPGLSLRRPFLSLPKTRLVASLQARGLAWAEDPSNRDLRFARARWRARLGKLPFEERRALLSAISAAEQVRQDADGAVAALLPGVGVDPGGTVAIDRRSLLSNTIAAKGLLSRALTAAGGASKPPSGRESERLLDRIAEGEGMFVATLGGCRIAVNPRRVEILREFGREGPPTMTFEGDRGVCFDQRFDIAPFSVCIGGQVVPLKRLGRGGLRDATLPVVLDRVGTPRAAHPSALPRLGRNVTPLSCRERVSWRLAHDLPVREDVIQIAAKAPEPVGKEKTADYLPV